MTTHKEALNLALEALKGWCNQPEDCATYDSCLNRAIEAITAIEEALAQPPVPYVVEPRTTQPEQEQKFYQPAANEAVEILKALGYVYEQTDAGLAWIAKEPEHSAPHGEPVAHCEAGPEYCWKCNEEMKPTYGSEEIRKLREVNKSLSDHIPDARKMVEALREIGDFAHDKSTGPTVPDALWEIRSMAYDAMVEFRLMEEVAHQPVPTAQPKEPYLGGVGVFHPQEPEQEPVAHCEGGAEFCPVCRAESRSLALAAAIGYVQRNTPSLVSTEICNALNQIVDVNKMVEASKGKSKT